jgi:hypothetical protein
MVPALSHIELELAPCPAHRFGDSRHAYHLYLPLGADDRLDLKALQQANIRRQVRRFRPTESTRFGDLTLDPDGWLAFRFDGEQRNHRVGFRSPPDRFVVGQVLPIIEEDGERRPFQVIAIRHGAHCSQDSSFAA